MLPLSSGCDCGGAASRPTPAPIAEAPETPEGAPSIEVTVPRTERTALPEARPQVTLSADVRGYRVDNRALVETWPPPERARAAEQASPLDPGFPVVDVTLATVDPSPLLIPDLRDAMARAAAADRARDPEAGAPIAFALRASSELRWGRVVRALYASAMVGYAEPSFVVRDASGTERVIVVQNDHAPSIPHADERVRAALASIGAPVAPAVDAPAVSVEDAASGPPIALVLEEHGLRVQRGLVWLGGDCVSPSAEASPALPSAQLDGARLTTCLEALGPFDRATFSASPEVAYGRVILVLEALAITGRPLSIATTTEDE